MLLRLSPFARLFLVVGALVGGGFLLYAATTPYLAARALGRADEAVSWGRFDEALDALERAQKLTPRDARVWRKTGEVQELIYAWRAAPDATRDAAPDVAPDVAVGAVAAYTRALALNPQDAALYGDLGQAQAAQGHLAEAQTAFEAALARDPHNAALLYALGRLLEQSGRPNEAASLYKRALAVRDDARIAARLEALEARK